MIELDDIAEDWDEAEILRTKRPATLEKVKLVKSIFHGARVVK